MRDRIHPAPGQGGLEIFRKSAERRFRPFSPPSLSIARSLALATGLHQKEDLFGEDQRFAGGIFVFGKGLRRPVQKVKRPLLFPFRLMVGRQGPEISGGFSNQLLGRPAGAPDIPSEGQDRTAPAARAIISFSRYRYGTFFSTAFMQPERQRMVQIRIANQG